jgi:hypothetical protein
MTTLSIRHFRGQKRRVLDSLRDQPCSVAEIAGSGLTRAADELRTVGLIERCDDENVRLKGAPALRLTEAGRRLFGLRPDLDPPPSEAPAKFDYTGWALRAVAQGIEADLGIGYDIADETPNGEKARDAIRRIAEQLQRRADKRRAVPHISAKNMRPDGAANSIGPQSLRAEAALPSNYGKGRTIY